MKGKLVAVAVCTAILVLASLLACPTSVRAGPDEDGWEALESVPGWVSQPPVRKGWIRAVDVRVVQFLSWAYDPRTLLHELLNVRWYVETRLRPILGDGAVRVARRGASAATLVRKGYVATSSSDSYTAFLLFEAPLDRVLEAVPEQHRPAARTALLAPAPGPAWRKTEGEPRWARTLPPDKDKFFVVIAKAAERADLARVLADLQTTDHVRFEIAARLKFFMGNRAAYTSADRVLPHGVVLARSWQGDPATAWLLWSVPVARVLGDVPVPSRAAVLGALCKPVPPEPHEWQYVEAEPTWVKTPPRWSGCIPLVQTASGNDTERAQTQIEQKVAIDVQAHLEKLLGSLVGTEVVEAAALAAVRRRVPVARAVLESDVPLGVPDSDARGIHSTVWILWQLELDAILDALEPKHRAAARRILLR